MKYKLKPGHFFQQMIIQTVLRFSRMLCEKDECINKTFMLKKEEEKKKQGKNP